MSGSRKTVAQARVRGKTQRASETERRREEAARQVTAERRMSGRMIFYQAVILFVVGCVFGTYWEEIIQLVKSFWATGAPVWESRRGLVYGPFSPVYGVGAVLIYLVFYLTKAKAWMCFVGGAVFGGVLEYVLSLLQEWVFGTRSWDYSDRLLDIGGRTTMPYMIVWGGLVVMVVKWICPLIDEICRGVAEKKLRWLCVGLTVFLIIDAVVSVAAVWRQTQRRAGDPADTPIEQILDQRFPDERLKKVYSNMREVE